MKATETVEELFARQTRKEGDCWLWTGAKARGLYGHTWHQGYGGLVQVHRLSYEHFVRPLDPSEEIHHKCATPACVNPDHLQAVANKTEHARIDPRYGRRHVKSCPKGHRYTPENTRWTKVIVRGKAYKGRACRTCHRLEEAVSTEAFRQLTTEPAFLERLAKLKETLRKSQSDTTGKQRD